MPLPPRIPLFTLPGRPSFTVFFLATLLHSPWLAYPVSLSLVFEACDAPSAAGLVLLQNALWSEREVWGAIKAAAIGR